MSRYVRTLKLPVHYLTTKRKLSVLDKLTARHTYAVRLFCEEISNSGQKVSSRKQIRQHSRYVQKKTGLSTGFIQQAEDKALWMWLSYYELHKVWRYHLKRAKTGTKRYNKILKREPSKPCVSSRSKINKIPVWFDERTGELQEACLVLTKWIVRISTLEKGKRINVLLNPSTYHKEMIEQADRIKSFQIIKKNKKYFVHVVCEYVVVSQSLRGMTGVDLGINRPLSTVLVDEKIRFVILKNDKQKMMGKLNDHISHLQRQKKYDILKKLRHKRNKVAEQFDRLLAKDFASQTIGYFAFIGDPAYIRQHNFKGNGKRGLRKKLQGWSFRRQSNYIVHEKAKQGDQAEIINEWWTSSRCCICGSRVERPKQSRIICKNNHQYDADFNGSSNILMKGISRLRMKSFASQQALNKVGVTVDIAQNRR